MFVLVKGLENEAKVKLLIELTKIESEGIKGALIAHLCQGMKGVRASYANGVKQQNFNRALKKLNQVNALIEQIKEIDWNKLN